MKHESEGGNHPKVRFRAVFTALHAEAKRHNGGINGLAMAIGKNPHSFSNKINPMNLGSEPTCADLLEAIEHLQARRVVTQISMLADCVSVPVETLHDGVSTDVIGTFMRLVNHSGAALQTISKALEDKHLDRSERAEALDFLISLQAAVFSMMAAVRN